MRTFILLFIFLLLSSRPATASGDGNFIESDMLASMKPGDKAAILMVHFGTTYEDTRKATIDIINDKIKKAFPGIDVKEAWTSRIIIRRLKARDGIVKSTPGQMLEQLRKEGYTHILIQSTNIIEGVEMESIRREAEAAAPGFKEIRVGAPLLYSVEDYARVADILKKTEFRGNAVLVGHGTYTPATASYAMLDYMLQSKGMKNFCVGTIEGYPAFEEMMARLKTDGTGSEEVTLIPFMFVAGDHARNDIAADWKEAIERQGYKVSVRMEGLGQNPDIQDMFIDHARFMLKHKMKDIMEKKNMYFCKP